MANKKKKELEKQKQQERNRKILYTVLIAVLVVVAVFVGVWAKNKVTIGAYTKIITKESVRESAFGFAGTLSNPRILTDPAQFSDSFAAEDILDNNGTKVGTEVTILVDNPSFAKNKQKIPSEHPILLIVDNDLKIKTLTPFNPTYFDLGINFDDFFKAFVGKDAEAIIKQNDGISTGDSNVAAVIKNKTREAMSFLYIENYGRDKFNALGVSGYIFSERGTSLEPVKFKAADGTEYDLNEFKNNKLVIIGGNPGCGSCVESITSIGNYFKTVDTSNLKFIVIAFTDDVNSLKSLTDVLPEGTIGVLDPDRKVAEQLKVNISPYIELVDKNLTVYYRGPGEPSKDTMDNIKAFLGE